MNTTETLRSNGIPNIHLTSVTNLLTALECGGVLGQQASKELAERRLDTNGRLITRRKADRIRMYRDFMLDC